MEDVTASTLPQTPLSKPTPDTVHRGPTVPSANGIVESASGIPGIPPSGSSGDHLRDGDVSSSVGAAGGSLMRGLNDPVTCGGCAATFQGLQAYMEHQCQGSKLAGNKPESDFSECDDSDGENFEGEIVYEPDGSAYIIEHPSPPETPNSSSSSPVGSAVPSLGGNLQGLGMYQPLLNAFHIPQTSYGWGFGGPGVPNSTYGALSKTCNDTPIVHSYRVYTLRKEGEVRKELESKDGEGSTSTEAKATLKKIVRKVAVGREHDSLSVSPRDAANKPILMCFLCKLSFGFTKSFRSHATGEHKMVLNEEEEQLLSKKDTSAIIQGVGKSKGPPLLSFLEPMGQPENSESCHDSSSTGSPTPTNSQPLFLFGSGLPGASLSSTSNNLTKVSYVYTSSLLTLPSVHVSVASASSSNNNTTSAMDLSSLGAKTLFTPAVVSSSSPTPSPSTSHGLGSGVLERQTPSLSHASHTLVPSGTNGSSSSNSSSNTSSTFTKPDSLLKAVASGKQDMMTAIVTAALMNGSAEKEVSQKSLSAESLAPHTSAFALDLTKDKTVSSNNVPPGATLPRTPESTMSGKTSSSRLNAQGGHSDERKNSVRKDAVNDGHSGRRPASTIAGPFPGLLGGESSNSTDYHDDSRTHSHQCGAENGVECPKCDMVLGSTRSLGGHMTMMHSRNSCKTLKCPKCNWHYKYQQTLEAHMKEKHPETGNACVYCSSGQPHPRLARGETYTCGYKPFRCDVCNYSTTTKGNLSIHMQSDKHINNVQEMQNKGKPDRMFAAPNNMGDPLAQSKPKPKPTWRCDVCDYETNVARNLRIHMTSEKHMHNMMLLHQNVKQMQDFQARLGMQPSPADNALYGYYLAQAQAQAQVHNAPLPSQLHPNLGEFQFDANLFLQQQQQQQLMGQNVPSVPMENGSEDDSSLDGPPPADEDPACNESLKLFQCAVCNKFTSDNLDLLEAHISGERPTQDEEWVMQVGDVYQCRLCNYSTQLKANFQLHCKTDKHTQKLQLVAHIKEGGKQNEWRLKYLNVGNPIQVKCNACDYYTNGVDKLRAHVSNHRHETSLKLFKHLQNADITVNSDSKFYHCSMCNYSSKAKLNLIQHVRSMKHLRNENLRKLQKEEKGEGGGGDDLADVFSIRDGADTESAKEGKDGDHPEAKDEQRPHKDGDGTAPADKAHTSEGDLLKASTPDVQGTAFALPSPSPGHGQQLLYPCPYCNYTTADQAHMKMHIISQHSVQPLVRCPLCQDACNDKYHLELHLTRLHNVTPDCLQRLLMSVSEADLIIPMPSYPATTSTDAPPPTNGRQAMDRAVMSALEEANRGEAKSSSSKDGDRDEAASGDKGKDSEDSNDADLLQCHKCQQVFTNFENLCQHQKETGHAPETSEDGQSFLCWKKGCNQYFKSSAAVQSHFREIHAKRQQVPVSDRHVYKYRCNQCSLAFKTMEKLQTHSQYHMIRAATKCSVCDRSFRTISSLHKHMETSHFDSTEAAKQVGARANGDMSYWNMFGDALLPLGGDPQGAFHLSSETATSPSSLMTKQDEESQDSELGDKKGRAEVDFGLLSKDGADSKSTTSEDDTGALDPSKPLTCDHCHVTCASQGELAAHYKSAEHRKSGGPMYPMDKYLDPNRPYKCDVCKESFTQKNILLVHYNSVSHLHKLKRTMQETGGADQSNGDKKPFKCNICNVAYSQGSTLDIHMRSVLHQTRAARLEAMAGSGKGGGTTPTPTQGSPQPPSSEPTTTEQKLADKLKEKQEQQQQQQQAQRIADILQQQQQQALAEQVAAQAQLHQVHSLFGNYPMMPLNMPSVYTCQRCNSMFVSQEALVQHQQMYCYLPEVSAAASASAASVAMTTPQPPFSSSGRILNSQRQILSDLGLEMVMAFNENRRGMQNVLNKETEADRKVDRFSCSTCKKKFSSIFILKTHEEQIHKVQLPLSHVEKLAEEYREEYDKKHQQEKLEEPPSQLPHTPVPAPPPPPGPVTSLVPTLSADQPLLPLEPMPSQVLETPPQLYQCDKCSLMFPSLDMWREHQKIHFQGKRPRTRITDEQLKILRAHFDINNSPSEDQILEMSEKSGLPTKVIKHWFRNTLFKERQRNKDSPYNFNNPPSTPLPEDAKNLTASKSQSTPSTEKVTSAMAAPVVNPPVTVATTTQAQIQEEQRKAEAERTARRAGRTRFTDYQIKVLQEFFEQNAYPKDDDLEHLSKILNLSPRVIVVWFQNARQKARKSFENQPTSPRTSESVDESRYQRTPGLNYQCKKCQSVFPRFFDLMKHQKQECYAGESSGAESTSSNDSKTPTDLKERLEGKDAAKSDKKEIKFPAAMPPPPPPSQHLMHYQCDKCNLAFPTFDLWREHQKVHFLSPYAPFFPSPLMDSPYMMYMPYALDQLAAHQMMAAAGASPLLPQSLGETSSSKRKHSEMEDGKGLSQDGQLSLSSPDQDSPREGNKRLRTTITPEQLEILYQKYQIDCNPTRKMLDLIAREVGLKKRVVQVWFQNTRARERKGQFRVTGPSLTHKRCPFCRAMFKAKTALDAHIKSRHWVELISSNKSVEAIIQSSETVTDAELAKAAAMSHHPEDSHSEHHHGKKPENQSSPRDNSYHSAEKMLARFAAIKQEKEDDKTDQPSTSAQHQNGENSLMGNHAQSEEMESQRLNKIKDELPGLLNESTASCSSMGDDTLGSKEQISPSIEGMSGLDVAESINSDEDGSHNFSYTLDEDMHSDAGSAGRSEESSMCDPQSPSNKHLPGKRYRTQMSNLQLKMLKSAFTEYKTPTMQECEILGNEIGLPKRVVQVWFQNARAKDKKSKLALGKHYPPGQFDKPKDECGLCGVKYSAKLSVRDHIFTQQHIGKLKNYYSEQLAKEKEYVDPTAMQRMFQQQGLERLRQANEALAVHQQAAMMGASPMMQMPGSAFHTLHPLSPMAFMGLGQQAGASESTSPKLSSPTAENQSKEKKVKVKEEKVETPETSLPLPGFGESPISAHDSLSAGSSAFLPYYMGTLPPYYLQQLASMQGAYLHQMYGAGAAAAQSFFPYDIPVSLQGTALGDITSPMLQQYSAQALQELMSPHAPKDLSCKASSAEKEEKKHEGHKAGSLSALPGHPCVTKCHRCKFICKKCQMAFPDEESAIGHQQTFCYFGRTFESEETLVRVYEDEYRCAACSERFAGDEQLDSHLRSPAHKTNAAKYTPPEKQSEKEERERSIDNGTAKSREATKGAASVAAAAGHANTSNTTSTSTPKPSTSTLPHSAASHEAADKSSEATDSRKTDGPSIGPLLGDNENGPPEEKRPRVEGS
ncbi:zinc finger homeobox protein 3-like isoform X1 [Branchiostoma lanceolatum]|uniref:zinc finger homeobox protein 3-like isoform X1 n=1 Tax=Branchiostoma lanceolatum TaxID=7740 RepID=UPI00345651A5